MSDQIPVELIGGHVYPNPDGLDLTAAGDEETEGTDVERIDADSINEESEV